MNKQRSMRHCRGQWSLIGMLVTIGIIMILAAVYMPALLSPSKDGARRSPTERAYGAGCTEYTAQINQAVMMYKMDHDDHPPTSFEDLKPYKVTKGMIHAQGCDFRMDPKTGQVKDVGNLPTAQRPSNGIVAGGPQARQPAQTYTAPAQPAQSYSAPAAAAPADNSYSQPAAQPDAYAQQAPPSAPAPAADPDGIPAGNSNPANIHLRDVAGGGAAGF
jgi:type II secretory pathway pseudopilin PulG